MREKPQQTPAPAAFRAWVRDALGALGLRPSALSESLGLGRNAITQFLGDEGRDIRLGTAATIERALRDHAAGAGKGLGPIEGRADG